MRQLQDAIDGAPNPLVDVRHAAIQRMAGRSGRHDLPPVNRDGPVGDAVPVAEHVHEGQRAVLPLGKERLHALEARFFLCDGREHEIVLGRQPAADEGVGGRHQRRGGGRGVGAGPHHPVARDGRLTRRGLLVLGHRGQVVERRHEHQCLAGTPADAADDIGGGVDGHIGEADAPHLIRHGAGAVVLLARRRDDGADLGEPCSGRVSPRVHLRQRGGHRRIRQRPVQRPLRRRGSSRQHDPPPPAPTRILDVIVRFYRTSASTTGRRSTPPFSERSTTVAFVPGGAVTRHSAR